MPVLAPSFGIWPPAGAVIGTTAPSDAGVVDYYVSPSLGDDINPGTQSQPLATLEEVNRRIPIVVSGQHRVHLRAETYPLPDTGAWLTARLCSGRVSVFGDPDWDPSVYAVARADTTAAGSTAAVLVSATGGMVVDAYKGKSLRMTSGPALGQLRRIIANDATTISLSEFVVAVTPGGGDTFEIFDPAAEVQIPASSTFEGYFVADEIQSATNEPDYIDPFPHNVPGAVGRGIEFRLLRFVPEGGAVAFGQFSHSTVYLPGVDIAAQVQLDFIACQAYTMPTQVFSGAPITEEGWGTRVDVAGGMLVFRSYLYGTVCADGLLPFLKSSKMLLLGGYGEQLRLTYQSWGSDIQISGTYSGVDFYLGTNGVLTIELSSGTIELKRTVGGGVTLHGQVVVSNGALLTMDGSVTGDNGGANAVSVASAGKVICLAAPAFGDGAANDWDVRGAAAFNKGALAAAGSFVLGTDTSVATRS